jgi:hydrogenase expression/formation protein HypC
MCLAIPGQVVEVLDAAAPFTAGLVEFAGVRRQVSLACVPEAAAGDYVLVHAGVAISRINAAEAEKVLAALQELELAEEEGQWARGVEEQDSSRAGEQPGRLWAV